MNVKLNVAKLVKDLGGPAAAARIAGVVRTAPYGWIARGYMGSTVLERIKAGRPELDLNKYFEFEDSRNVRRQAVSST